MSTSNRSVALSHCSIYAFLANDIPFEQLQGDKVNADLVIQKGSRIMLTHFPQSNIREAEQVRFYSNEYAVHGVCLPSDILDFDLVVGSYITLKEKQALPFEEEASSIPDDARSEVTPSVISTTAQMEKFYGENPEFPRGADDTVVDADDTLAQLMSTTDMRLEATPNRNARLFPPTSTPAPSRPKSVVNPISGKRQNADTTMMNREQLAQAEETRQVEDVVSQKIGSVATGVQDYARRNDVKVNHLSDLVSSQVNQMTLLQQQMSHLTTVMNPATLAESMANIANQCLNSHMENLHIESRMDALKASPAKVPIPAQTTKANKSKASGPRIGRSEKTNDPPLPTLKPRKGRRSTRFMIPDSDSDSDSDINDLIYNRTFDPQSSKMYSADAMFADGSDLAEDSLKSAENAMKRIRGKSDIVPKWTGSNDGLLSIFLCKKVFSFARKQGLLNEKFLKYWISYVFPEENEEKVYMYLNEIRSSFPKANLYKTLRALAFRMCPSEKTSIDELPKRKSHEGLLDLVLRLKVDIPICADVKESEIPLKISEFIRTHEKDSTVRLEFKKAVQPYGRKITVKQLLKISESLDELLETHAGHHATKFQQVTATSDTHTDREALELLLDTTKTFGEKIAALEQQRGVQQNISQTTKCQKCSADAQPKKSGGFYPHCRECFKNKVQGQKQNLYSNPPVQAESAKCSVCKRSHRNMNQSGKPFPTCYDCFQDSRKKKSIGDISKWNNVQAKPAINSCKVSLQEVKNEMTKTYALAIDANEIFEVTTNSYDPDRYRMNVKVTTTDGSKSTRALIDTGANNEVLSLQACYDLGLTHLIEKDVEKVTLADGTTATVRKLTTTLNIGAVPYTSTFLVMDSIDGYGMMVGTQFLQSKDMLNEIQKVFEDTLGRDNVGRGN